MIGTGLYYVEHQTDEICIAAVKQLREALRFVRDPELKSRLEAGNFELRQNYKTEGI